MASNYFEIVWLRCSLPIAWLLATISLQWWGKKNLPFTPFQTQQQRKKTKLDTLQYLQRRRKKRKRKKRRLWNREIFWAQYKQIYMEDAHSCLNYSFCCAVFAFCTSTFPTKLLLYLLFPRSQVLKRKTFNSSHFLINRPFMSFWLLLGISFRPPYISKNVIEGLEFIE